MDPRDVEHRGDAPYPSAIEGIADRVRDRSFELELRGRQGTRSQLVLQATDPDLVRGPFVERPMDPEQCQALRTLGGTLGTSQRQCHLRCRRAGEPLGPEETPGA